MRGFNKPKSAVLILIGINIAVFLIQIITQFLGIGFTDFFALHKGDLFFRPYTLLTSMFMHGGITHILINMFVLFMFGGLLEQKIGTKRFFIVYFIAGLLAAAVSSFIYPSALGASGAVMGVMGVVMVLLPNLMVLFFFIIPMPLWIAGIVIALIEVFGAFGTGGSVANVAHLVGMATGLGYGFYLRKSSRKFKRKMSSTKHLNDDDIEDYIKMGRI